MILQLILCLSFFAYRYEGVRNSGSSKSLFLLFLRLLFLLSIDSTGLKILVWYFLGGTRNWKIDICDTAWILSFCIFGLRVSFGGTAVAALPYSLPPISLYSYTRLSPTSFLPSSVRSVWSCIYRGGDFNVGSERNYRIGSYGICRLYCRPFSPIFLLFLLSWDINFMFRSRCAYDPFIVFDLPIVAALKLFLLLLID